ncbi:MAG: carboxypeptidase-like regulatory domain-containing protein [Acidobacteriota bacterium]|nr:carboxypeptidase-like regulatory domain-containing protein [Acidobacteriota bacterium]
MENKLDTVVERRTTEAAPVSRKAPDEGALLHGRVLAAGNGEPVADARVMISGSSKHEEFTAEDGSFRFTDLRPGEYYLAAVTHDAVSFPSRLDPTFQRQTFIRIDADTSGIGPVTLYLHRAQTLTVIVNDIHGEAIADARIRAAHDAVRDFRLWFQTDEHGRASFPLTRNLWELSVFARSYTYYSSDLSMFDDNPGVFNVVLHPAGRLYGQVTDRNGAPLQEVRVKCNDYLYTLTDSEGNYSLDHLPLDEHLEMWVSKEGYISERIPPIMLSPGEPEARLDTRLTLRPVEDGVVLLHLQDPSGRSVDGEVWVHRATVTREGPGRFNMGNLQVGTKETIEIAAPGYLEKEYVAEVTRPNQAEVQIVKLEPAAEIGGVVLDDEGNPISGVVVKIEDDSSWTMVAETNHEGVFYLGHVPKKKVRLLFENEWYKERRLKVNAADQDGDPLMVVLRDAAKLTLKVRDKRTGEPLERFRYKLRRDWENRENRIPYQYQSYLGGGIDVVNTTGRTIVPGMPNSATYKVTVSAPNYQPQEKSITFFWFNWNRTLKFELEPQLEKRAFRLVDSSQRPLPGIPVDAVHFDVKPIRFKWEVYRPAESKMKYWDNCLAYKVYSDAEGLIKVADPLPDSHFVLFTGPAGRGFHLAMDWQLPPAGDRPVDLTLFQEARVHGKIDPGTFPEGVRLDLVHEETPEAEITLYLQKGDTTYLLPGLPPGNYGLRASSWETGSLFRLISLAEGQDLSLDLQDSPITFEGQVTLGDEDMTDHRVFLVPFGMSHLFQEEYTDVDTNGFFRFEKFFPGTYDLLVQRKEGRNQTHWGYTSDRIRLDLTRSQSGDVYAFTPRAKVRGRTVPENKWLYAVLENKETGRRTKFNAKGNFEVVDLDAGDYRLIRSVGGDEVILRKYLVLEPGETLDIGEVPTNY